MFKKFLSCILAIAMMLSFFGTTPMTVSAETTTTADRVHETENQEAIQLAPSGTEILRGTSGGFDAYCWVVYNPSGSISPGPATIAIPGGTLQSIRAVDYGTIWMAGADFVGDTWYAVSYSDSNSGLYTIDKDTGEYTLIGLTGHGLTGFTYDVVNEVAYVSDISNLYTIDLTTAATTLVGSINPSSVIIGIAANKAGDLYALDLVTRDLYAVNKATGAGTSVGNTGLSLNFAQDICFDRDNNILYGTLYVDGGSAGGFYSINTSNGAATLINNFVAEVDALAIPYTTGPAPAVDDTSLKAIGITDNAAMLVWKKASDDVTPQDQLTYTVYYSTDPMTDQASIESGTQFGSETADIASTSVNGLSENTNYYFGVIVKDGDNNKSFIITQASTVEAAPWTNVGSAGFSAGTANFTSLAIYNGTPYVAYMDSANGNKASLMKYVGGGWQTVGNAGFTPGYADSQSLYISPDGSPYVAFRDGTCGYRASAMKYTEGTGWEYVGTPGFSGDMAGDITLVVDNGVPYVAYKDNSTMSRATAKKYDAAANSWVTLGNPSGFSANGTASLSLSVIEGIPYVAYSDLAPAPNNCRVTVQSYENSSNTWLPVGTTGLESAFGQYLAINSYQNGDHLSPVIAYGDLNNGSRATVMLYDSAANSWSPLGEPGFSVIDVYEISIANNAGNYYLAYNGMSDRSATVMKWDGSKWISYGKSGFSAGNTSDLSFAYDAANDITYAAYQDGANGGRATVMKYGLDFTAPEVVGIFRQVPTRSTISSTRASFRITFNEPVSGVDIDDFCLTATGTVHAGIAAVTAVDEANYDIAVNRISGNGTLSLNLKNSNTDITDLSGNPLSTGYSDGESYHIRQLSAGSSDSNGGGTGGSSGTGTTVNNNSNTDLPEIIVSTEIINGSVRTSTVAAAANTAGNAAATMSSRIVDALLTKAAAEKGIAPKDIIELSVKTLPDSKQLEVTIPHAALAKFAAETDSALRISSALITITFDSKAIEKILTVGAGDIVISANIGDAANVKENQRSKVNGRPVYALSVKNGDTLVNNFGAGHATVRIPYALKQNENPNAILVYYLANDGSIQIVSSHFNAAASEVIFTTGHFSSFAVAYNPVSFKDVKSGAWYKNAVDFIAAREISAGTEGNRFGPEISLSRGQFMVLLMNAYQIAPLRGTQGQFENFADAGSTYYTDYLAAAKAAGLAKGIGNNRFAPNQKITRQEMFVLLYNVLKEMNALPASISNKQLASFNDAKEVSSWAKEALSVLMNAGIASGNNNELNPQATTTRAEMAQVLFNLLSK